MLVGSVYGALFAVHFGNCMIEIICLCVPKHLPTAFFIAMTDFKYDRAPITEAVVEFRVPDGSADIYHLMAGLILAGKEGVLAKDSLKNAEKLYVNVNIFEDEHKDIYNSLVSLPNSCSESAEYLEKDSKFYQKDGVFPKGTINEFVTKLKNYNDKDLSERLYNKKDEIKELVDKYIHCM